MRSFCSLISEIVATNIIYKHNLNVTSNRPFNQKFFVFIYGNFREQFELKLLEQNKSKLFCQFKFNSS